MRSLHIPRFTLAEVTILVASLMPAVAMSQTEGLPPVPPAAGAAEEPEEVPAGDGTSDQDLEVLTRGPLHEAFAAPIEQNPEPGQFVEVAPPDPIEELPPEVKPEGENIEWIPGYWAWDEDEKRYIWISGVWRSVPPGREWVPGYWSQEGESYRWVSGYWGAAAPSGTQVARSVYDAAQQAEAYVAPPPESLEVGPTSPAPTDQHFWIPGCWIASDTNYLWRPGYWYEYVPNWVWVPDHYVWTPAGCIFVPGYWDYTLQARGMCFAPVTFTRAVYQQPYYVYRPHYALEVAQLALHLFVHPRGRYYCYGDYYGPTYAGYGYRPWFQFHFSHYDRPYYRRCYDPLLAYYGTHFHKHGVDYVGRLRGWHRYYDRHVDYRPRRTLGKQVLIAQTRETSTYHQHVLARSVEEYRHTRYNGRRVVELDRTAGDSSARWRRQVNAVREVARARRTLERDAELPRVVGRDGNSRRVIVDNGGATREQVIRRELGGDQPRPGREVVTARVPEERRAEYRQAVERARELSRNARQEGRVRTTVVQPPSRVGEQRLERRVGAAERPVIVRGQQPDRDVAELRSPQQRERVLRLDRTGAEELRDRAVGRIESLPERRSSSRAEVGAERADQNRQQVIDAARRAREAAVARQRSLESSGSMQRLDAGLSREAESLRRDSPTDRARTFSLPQRSLPDRGARERVIPRQQIDRPRSEIHRRDLSQFQQREQVVPRQQIERSRPEVLRRDLSQFRQPERVMPREQTERPRPEIHRRDLSQFQRREQSRASATPRPQVQARTLRGSESRPATARPSFNARQWRTPDASSSAVSPQRSMQSGSVQSRIERPGPASGSFRGFRGRGGRDR